MSIFHPLIRAWFSERFREPTASQREAWPHIAAGEHVLVTAPTGSGKTLTAFLWALDQLARGAWAPGAVRVLYISPLRALNNDIRRNLLAPLAELREVFEAAGAQWPPLDVATRSGDTPPAARRRMLRHPPEILITTPESLNILLTSASGAALLQHVQSVIIDEVHAVAGTKRGTHLMTAIERLVLLAGEFQRIALSATVRPLERVASWIGGYQRSGEDYRPRPVRIIAAGGAKAYDIAVSFRRPAEARPPAGAPEVNPIWHALASEVAARIREKQATLVFANSRRVVERVAQLVNARESRQLVYSHHGSLSREIREVVEERLKAGELAGIVATSSLELGIDVGEIDQVLMLETPPTVASAVQRLGRAGHQVGEVSAGRIYPIHSADILAAAVVVRSLLDGEIEPLKPPEAPLDILAQVILSMTAREEWPLAALYDFLRTCAPYHHLSRTSFDLVIEMLAGRYVGSRIRTLRARLSVDRIAGTVRARPGTARLLYAAGGTIPERGLYRLKLAGSRSVIGELDEEFVWERSVGDTITLGVQSWRIVQITHNDVQVTPSAATTALAPFWRHDGRTTGFWLADRRGRFLEEVDGELEDDGLAERLQTEYRLDEAAAEELIRYLKLQRAALHGRLPHRHHIVVEQIADAGRPLTVLHTQWGGRVNRPFALALRAALAQHAGRDINVLQDEMCVALETDEPLTADMLLALVSPDEIEKLIRQSLEETGFFGAHFRESAGRALLLPRAGFGRRTPLWLNRQRSKELQAAVAGYTDFPIMLETWRTCLTDEFDLPALRALLEELTTGAIAVSEVKTEVPSPFATEVIYRRTNELMYATDTGTHAPSQLRADLIEEMLFSTQLRPRIPDPLARELTEKLQRTYPGYAPPDAPELIEWVKERLLIPAEEWRALLAAIERDHSLPREEILAGIAARVVAVGGAFVCAIENIPRLEEALARPVRDELRGPGLDGAPLGSAALDALARVATGSSEGDLAALLTDWLCYYGPQSPAQIARALTCDADDLPALLADLQQEQRLVIDKITIGAEGLEVCDPDNLARLLRLVRQAARPAFEPLSAALLPLFFATHQRLAETGNEAALPETLEKLFGYAAAVALWEEEILPARLSPYRRAWLDALLAESDLIWFGQPKQRLGFLFGSDRDLLGAESPDPGAREHLARIFPELPGRFAFTDLLATASSADSGELTDDLWQLTWAGLITNDAYATIRQGITSGFKVTEMTAPASAHRSRFSRWRAQRAFTGCWYRLPPVTPGEDALAQEELNRDRLRLLLERYGILFRDLLKRELPVLQWPALFRSLRLMEFSGEVIGGCFIRDIAGPQFIAPRALARLRSGLPTQKIYWLNAADPASVAGLKIAGLEIPARVATTHLVYRGAELVLTSRRRGRQVQILPRPEDPELPEIFGVFQAQLEREFRPRRAITVETINEVHASQSEYRQALASIFDLSGDHQTLRLTRRF